MLKSEIDALLRLYNEFRLEENQVSADVVRKQLDRDLTRIAERLRRKDPAARQVLGEFCYEVSRPLVEKLLRRGFPQLRRQHDIDSLMNAVWLRMQPVFDRCAGAESLSNLDTFLRLVAFRVRRALLDCAVAQRRWDSIHHSSTAQTQGDSQLGYTGVERGTDDQQDPALLAQWTEIHTQVDALPPQEKEVFTCRYYLNLPWRESVVPPQTNSFAGANQSHPAIPDGYALCRELGRGGMGVVYLARQTTLNRDVAIKITQHALSNRSLLARFHQEAEALGRLQHSHIVQVYDHQVVGDELCIIMEYVNGVDLARRIKDFEGRYDDIARLVSKVAMAMEYAHSQRILHRDLKPANILLTTNDQPKVSDFGLALFLDRKTSQRLTPAGEQNPGTPVYMAPEQASGERKPGPAVDIHALGSILYELLTGRPPFLGETPVETLNQVITAEPIPPSRLVVGVPRNLETICLRCLAKRPAARFKSAQALAEDLDRYACGKPVHCRPISGLERLMNWSFRNRLAACLSATLAVTVLVAVLAVVFFYWQASSHLANLEQFAAFMDRHIFSATNPPGWGGMGKDALQLQVIKAAIPKIDQELRDYPLAQGYARSACGGLLLSCGE